MDKRVCLLIVLLLVGFIFVNSVSAGIESSIEDSATKLENTANNIDNFVSYEDARSDYLKKEWGKVLGNNSGFFGKVYRGYNKVSPYSDPTLEYVVGMVPSLSWMFVLVFAIWFMLVKYFYTFYEVFRDFSTFSDVTSILVSLCLFVILIVLQLFQGIAVWGANKIIDLIGIMNSPIMQIIFVVMTITIFALLARFSKGVKIFAKFIKMWNYKRKKEADENERNERQESATRAVEKIADAAIGRK